MYEKHPHFESPEPSATLWRYMDLSKLIALLNKNCLFFARADTLGDPWEGAASRANVILRSELDAQTNLGYQRLGDLYRASRKHTYISCWHENSYESAAMWRLYLKSDEGIAIQTTFERLRDSIKTDKDVFIGRMRYYDPETDKLPEGNVLRPYVFKRISFSHEQEVRAVVQASPPLGFDEEPLFECGLDVPIETDKLIENAYMCADESCLVSRSRSGSS